MNHLPPPSSIPPPPQPAVIGLGTPAPSPASYPGPGAPPSGIASPIATTAIGSNTQPLAPTSHPSPSFPPAYKFAHHHPPQSHLSPQSGEDQSPEAHDSTPRKKRNKPTLNCADCVERKTKCDRARPSCLACLRRQTTCRYTAIADLIAATGPSKPRKRKLSQRSPHSSNSPGNADSLDQIPPVSAPVAPSVVSNPSKAVPVHPKTDPASKDRLKDGSAPQHPFQSYWAGNGGLLFNTVGMSSHHPFHNYWTGNGGLTEVIDVLPPKLEADALMTKYFQTIDPIYPIIRRDQFMLDYERFWALPVEKKIEFDPTHLALQFAIYATGMQYMEGRPHDERVTSAEFYLSACHQALCIFSYLHRSSICNIQTMIIICNFLINNNRVADAWNFSGITQRQAYGLELNRDPNIVRPKATFAEKQHRCRLWMATMFQDTSLSLFLALPPATIHYDIYPSSLRRPDTDEEFSSPRIADLSSILSPSIPSDLTCPTDISYLRSMWDYACFVQTNLCIPNSLKRPMCADPAHKTQLITRFRELYANFDEPFNSYDPRRYDHWNARVVRQLFSVASNYFYVLTYLYMDKNESTGVTCDVYGALDAAHEGMYSFFEWARLTPEQVDMWGAPHTRAYSQAAMIGQILSTQRPHADGRHRDARLMLAMSDFDRYVDILSRARGGSDFEDRQKRCLADLQSLRKLIKVV